MCSTVATSIVQSLNDAAGSDLQLRAFRRCSRFSSVSKAIVERSYDCDLLPIFWCRLSSVEKSCDSAAGMDSLSSWLMATLPKPSSMSSTPSSYCVNLPVICVVMIEALVSSSKRSEPQQRGSIPLGRSFRYHFAKVAVATDFFNTHLCIKIYMS